MYYILGRLWARSRGRRPDHSSFDRQGVWWNDGHIFTAPIRTPIEARLEPFNPLSPEQSPALPAAFINVKVPLFRDDLIEALREAGVDNIDCYDARLIDPDNGRAHTNYKAVNILGMVAAADMKKSVATVHDGIPLVDVSFDKLVIDHQKTYGFLLFRLAENNSAIVIHERVKRYLLAKGFDELEFFKPENIAL